MRDEVIDMEESDFYTLVNTDRMGIFLICIKNKQGELSGDIVNFYLKEPVAFTGPSSTTCAPMRAIKRPSDVPPVVSSCGLISL